MPNYSEQQIEALFERVERLEKQMSTSNTTIAQLATDFGKFQSDATDYFGKQTGFNQQLKAFLTSLASGSTGTTLSAADQDSLNVMDQALSGLDSQTTALNSAVGGFTLPSTPSV